MSNQKYKHGNLVRCPAIWSTGTIWYCRRHWSYRNFWTTWGDV